MKLEEVDLLLLDRCGAFIPAVDKLFTGPSAETAAGRILRNSLNVTGRI